MLTKIYDAKWRHKPMMNNIYNTPLDASPFRNKTWVSPI